MNNELSYANAKDRFRVPGKSLIQTLKDQQASNLCYECRTCSSVCPAYQLGTSLDPREIVRAVSHPETFPFPASSDLPAYYYCTTCHSCSSHCPQGIPIAELMEELRQATAWEMINELPRLVVAHQNLEDGFAGKVTAGLNRKRQKLGLPPVQQPDKEVIKKVLDSLEKRGAWHHDLEQLKSVGQEREEPHNGGNKQ